MIKIHKLFSKLKTSLKNGFKTLPTSFEEAKQKPVSKRLLGFTSVTSLLGVTIVISRLRVMAKDIPKTPAVVLTPPWTSPTRDIIKTTGLKSLATFVGDICAAAVIEGSFALLFASNILARKNQKPN